MLQVLPSLLICLATVALAADGPLPAELAGEWRSPRARPPYDALYLHPDGTAYSVAVSDGLRNHGGKGTATYDAFRRTLTISFPADNKLLRFRYDEKAKRLQDVSRPSQSPYKRKSDKPPDLSVPPNAGE